MTPMHFHLMTNHIPVLGALFGTVLLGLSLLAGKEENRKGVLGIFIFLAIITPAVFFSGAIGKHAVSALPGIEPSLIEAHSKTAGLTLAGVEVLGLFALATWILFFFPTMAQLRIRAASATFLCGVAVTGMLAWTAMTGGRIGQGDGLGLSGSAGIEVASLSQGNSDSPCESGMLAFMAWKCLTSDQVPLKP